MDINLEEVKKEFPPYSGKIGHNFIDRSGQKFGHLTLLYRGENDPTVARPRARYVCLCDCGNIIIRRGENIIQRQTNCSCGHCKEFIFSQLKELKNFNILETYYSKEDNRWHCVIECKTCHAIFDTRRTNLYDNYDYQCPKCNRSHFKIGDVVGELTILSKKVNDDNHLKYLCRCSCGKEIWLNGFELNHRRTCGTHNNPEDIVGEIFGKLTVLASTNEIRGGQRMYLCECECGTQTLIGRSNLITGHTSSCGCINSKGEEKISKLLLNNNINFEKAKTFSDLYRQSKCAKLKFDFYVLNNYVIEYDGEQHFGNKIHDFCGWHTEEHFKLTRERDLFKNKYCFEHNIPLIRIPCWKLNSLCIEDLLLDTTSFLITPENECLYYKN